MNRWLRVVVLGLVGCSGANPATGSVDGAEIFAKLCTTCHGSNGQPSAAMVARLGVRDLTSPELRARVTPALVEHQIRDGSPNKLMPGFDGLLDDAQIKALAAYVASPGFIDPGAAR